MNEENKSMTSMPPRGPRRGPMGGGPGAHMMPGEKAKDFKGSIGKLMKFNLFS